MAEAGSRSGRGTRAGGAAGIALLAAVGLLSGACSSGGSKASASGSTTTSATTTTPTTSSPSSTPSSSTSSTTKPSTPSSSTKPSTPSSSKPVPPPTTSAIPPHLTLRQEAGQRIIYSYQGLTPPQHLLDLIRRGEAAGVIFFGGNISSRTQITNVINELRQAQAASPVHLPLLLMTDQEGGIVKRLPGPPDISAKQIGQSANPVGAASTAGTEAGQNMAGVGMNLNLAPVLDVTRAPGDFIDATQRSFSENPNTVSQLASAFLVAQQKTGVAATAKHFPGLGSAPSPSANTDERPVTLTVSLSNLRSIDELPYTAAVQNGVKLVMLSWAVYTNLDPNRPAGMSSTVVQQELRGRVGFKGVTITDALEAGALQAYGSAGNRALSAAEAGMDLMLCSSGDPAQGDAAATAIVNGVDSGKLSRSGFDAAVGRIDALRSGLR